MTVRAYSRNAFDVLLDGADRVSAWLLDRMGEEARSMLGLDQGAPTP